MLISKFYVSLNYKVLLCAFSKYLRGCLYLKLGVIRVEYSHKINDNACCSDYWKCTGCRNHFPISRHKEVRRWYCASNRRGCTDRFPCNRNSVTNHAMLLVCLEVSPKSADLRLETERIWTLIDRDVYFPSDFAFNSEVLGGFRCWNNYY